MEIKPVQKQHEESFIKINTELESLGFIVTKEFIEDDDSELLTRIHKHVKLDLVIETTFTLPTLNNLCVHLVTNNMYFEVSIETLSKIVSGAKTTEKLQGLKKLIKHNNGKSK